MNGLKDWRFWSISAALLLMGAVFLFPTQQRTRPIFNYTFIVDITRSMNALDYQDDGSKLSRLDYVKRSLQAAIKSLSCGSKVGLGVFTERRSTLLFEPIDVCGAYAELTKTIEELNWRMAWAADSRIAKGLAATLELLPKSETRLVFMTDGQEAPPVNPRYRSDFSAIKGKFKGLLVGIGGLERVPIPKFNAQGEPSGFYSAEDVPHRSTFGESDLNPESIKGYNARNAPFGNETVSGEEHLSALQEGYLQQLSEESGLQYFRLVEQDDLIRELHKPEFGYPTVIDADIRWLFALGSLLCVGMTFLSKKSTSVTKTKVRKAILLSIMARLLKN